MLHETACKVHGCLFVPISGEFLVWKDSEKLDGRLLIVCFNFKASTRDDNFGENWISGPGTIAIVSAASSLLPEQCWLDFDDFEGREFLEAIGFESGVDGQSLAGGVLDWTEENALMSFRADRCENLLRTCAWPFAL